MNLAKKPWVSDLITDPQGWYGCVWSQLAPTASEDNSTFQIHLEYGHSCFCIALVGIATGNLTDNLLRDSHCLCYFPGLSTITIITGNGILSPTVSGHFCYRIQPRILLLFTGRPKGVTQIHGSNIYIHGDPAKALLAPCLWSLPVQQPPLPLAFLTLPVSSSPPLLQLLLFLLLLSGQPQGGAVGIQLWPRSQ